MLENFSLMPSRKAKRLNHLLQRQFGFRLDENLTVCQLRKVAFDIVNKIQWLKQSGHVLKEDKELSKCVLLLETTNTLLETKLNEYSDYMNGRYYKVVDWLTDHAYKNIMLGDDYEDALGEAMRQYRSSKYRFSDDDVEYEVQKRLMKLLKQTDETEKHVEMINLDMNESEPWESTFTERINHLIQHQPKRSEFKKISESRVNAMRQYYVSQIRKLLETEVDQAEVIVNSKTFSDQLQEIIQKIGRMQNESLGPVIAQMRRAYGTDSAMVFQQKMHSELNAILDQIRNTKTKIDDAVLGMAAESDPNSDMDMMGGEETDLLGGELGFEETPSEESGEFGDVLDDMGGADAAAGGEEPMGRAELDMAAFEHVLHMQKRLDDVRTQLAEAKALKKRLAKKKS